jgi:hypothetical protein
MEGAALKHLGDHGGAAAAMQGCIRCQCRRKRILLYTPYLCGQGAVHSITPLPPPSSERWRGVSGLRLKCMT